MRPGGVRNQLALLAALSALAIFLYGAVPYTEEPYAGMDLRYYRAMAEASPGISSEMPRPFAYRILGPWLVGLLPLPETAAFYALNSVLSLCVPLVFFLLLVSRGAGGWIAALSAFLFVLSKHQFGMSAWNFFQIKDTLSFLCLLACFHAMYSDRRVLFAVSLLAGALAGEMALETDLLRWIRIPGASRDSTRNVVSVTVNHLTIFTLIGVRAATTARPVAYACLQIGPARQEHSGSAASGRSVQRTEGSTRRPRGMVD